MNGKYIYVYYENFIFGFKVKKKPPVLKAKIKSLIIYNQYIYSHKPWKPIMTSEIIYSQILITWYMIFSFPIFLPLNFIETHCFDLHVSFFLAFWHLFARVAFRFIRPDSYKKCKVNSNWLCNVHIQWN